VKEIYYVVHYDEPEKEYVRNFSPATHAKAGYVSKTIANNISNVQIISPALPNSKGEYKSSNKTISKNIKLKLFSSRHYNSKLLRLVRRITSKIKLITYVLKKVPRRSTILVYHSLDFMNTINFLTKIKNLNLIYEVNELYGDVKSNKKITEKELKYIRKAKAFVFPTKELEEIVNKDNKSFAINYGNYEIKKDYGERFDDEKIHCVYSGTLSIDKGGASAAAAGLYLNEDYHIHILGFGSEEEKKNLEDKISDVNARSKCKVTYDGLMFGENFDKFLQKCQIGLSTQTLDNNFNDTSFPSKILTYMGNGLNVVSVNIKPVFNSKMAENITFYNEDTPKAIAEAIKRTSNVKLDSRKTLKDLHVEFIKDFKKIILEIER
jgi:hypothetical protein